MWRERVRNIRADGGHDDDDYMYKNEFGINNLLRLMCYVTLWVTSLSLFVGASQRIPLSVLVRNPHKGLAREISHETGRMREERSLRSVGRRGESREGHSQQKGAEETSRQNRSVRRWESGREETSQQNSERQLLGPVDLQMPGWPTPEDKSALLVALWEFSLEYTLALPHRNTECTKNVT